MRPLENQRPGRRRGIIEMTDLGDLIAFATEMGTDVPLGQELLVNAGTAQRWASNAWAVTSRPEDMACCLMDFFLIFIYQSMWYRDGAQKACLRLQGLITGSSDGQGLFP